MIWDEVIGLLTSMPKPEDIIDFKPSDRLEQRLNDLLERNRQATLANEDKAELDEILRMNHFINMLKIGAREKLENDDGKLISHEKDLTIYYLHREPDTFHIEHDRGDTYEITPDTVRIEYDDQLIFISRVHIYRIDIQYHVTGWRSG